MAGSSLLTLLDDIATLLDDISFYSKLAAKKTAGVLGDDLALNAEQVAGIRADRELPVVWAVAKGAFLNKLILVPGALLISALLPWLIIVLLLIGGSYLCYEGFEKVFHKLLHKDSSAPHSQIKALVNPETDIVSYEREKVKGAIKTDFILSAEIIVLTLGTVSEASFLAQVGVLSAIAIGVTIFVYGLVAAIVKLDDAGLLLLRDKSDALIGRFKRRAGNLILLLAPYLMKLLSIVGTAAMFLVGGGIIVHNIPFVHHLADSLELVTLQIPSFGVLVSATVPVLTSLVVGILAGGLLVMVGTILNRFRSTPH